MPGAEFDLQEAAEQTVNQAVEHAVYRPVDHVVVSAGVSEVDEAANRGTGSEQGVEPTGRKYRFLMPSL